MSDRPSLRANQTFGAIALLAIARPRRIGIYFVYSDYITPAVSGTRGGEVGCGFCTCRKWRHGIDCRALAPLRLHRTSDCRFFGLDVLRTVSNLARNQPYNEAVCQSIWPIILWEHQSITVILTYIQQAAMTARSDIGLRLWAFGGISTLQRSLRCKRQFSDVGLRVCLILSSLTAPPLPFLVTPFINTTLGASATNTTETTTPGRLR
jgi:hypothetical protein